MLHILTCGVLSCRLLAGKPLAQLSLSTTLNGRVLPIATAAPLQISSREMQFRSLL